MGRICAENAIAKVNSLVNINKLHYAVDIDIKGFFDNVNHGKLLKQMWTLRIKDKALICIIMSEANLLINVCINT